MKTKKFTALLVALFFILSFHPIAMADEASDTTKEVPAAAGDAATLDEALPPPAETVSDVPNPNTNLENTAPAEAAAPTEAAPEAPAAPASWEKAPSIQVAKWGEEIRITVTPDKSMKEDKLLAIQSVKLETEKGEFLGLKTYGPEEKDRSAEFMVNPVLLKADNVKIIASSKIEGDWSEMVSLTPKAEGSAAGAEVQPAQPTTEKKAESEAKPEKKKKKGWF